MERNGQTESYLIINRVEVLDGAGCSACGREFSAEPAGEKTLVLSLGNNQRTYFFCGGCGDNIVGRTESEDAKKRYIWDWAVPLRAPRQSSQPIAEAA